MNLEQELRQALKRKSPPAGFADRVLSRVASLRTAGPPLPQTRWARLAMPVAASLTIAAAGAGLYVRHERQQQAQAERTARDVVLALQIASEKVSAAQARVQEIAHHERQID